MVRTRVRLRVLFFFTNTATTEIYTLSLHDALPICQGGEDDRQLERRGDAVGQDLVGPGGRELAGLLELGLGIGRGDPQDRKSTRLNSSHANISYAVFCLKKQQIKSAKMSKIMKAK